MKGSIIFEDIYEVRDFVSYSCLFETEFVPESAAAPYVEFNS